MPDSLDPPTAQPNDPLLGQQVGAFRVERLLATGGMGAVYLLRHVEHPNTRKVLKVIRKEYAAQSFLRERFLAEADALSQLGNHPSIVGMDDRFALPDGQLAILMPFCEGVPLEDYVARHGGKLAPHRAFYIACHIARALHHAHTRGIVHRDLKPSNVFVEDDDNDWARCRLLDFGVARRLTPSPGIPSHTVSGPLGTPDYMPPEQQDRAAEATAAADVFALAVVIWWMITGGLPWGIQTDPAILYLRKLQHPPDPPLGNTLPPEWEDVLRVALRPDPTMRPTLRQVMQTLARSLPGVGRLVPSGAEILQKLARVLWDESAPDDVTLRNPSNRTLLPAWPERDYAPAVAAVPASTPAPRHAPQPSQPMTLDERPAVMLGRVSPAPVSPSVPHVAGSGAALPTPAPHSHPSAPIATPPPAVAMPPTATTFGASSGVVMLPPSAPPKWKLVFVGVATVAVASLGTFAIATVRGHRGSTEPAAAARPTLPTLSPTATAPAATAPSTTTTTQITTAQTPPSPTTPPTRTTPPIANMQRPTTASSPTPLPTASRPSAKTQPPPADARDRGRPLAGIKVPGPDVPPGTTKSTTTANSPMTKSTRPDPAPGSANKFDPNAIGGQ